jgi:hypothetical protein
LNDTSTVAKPWGKGAAGGAHVSAVERITVAVVWTLSSMPNVKRQTTLVAFTGKPTPPTWIFVPPAVDTVVGVTGPIKDGTAKTVKDVFDESEIEIPDAVAIWIGHVPALSRGRLQDAAVSLTMVTVPPQGEHKVGAA